MGLPGSGGGRGVRFQWGVFLCRHRRGEWPGWVLRVPRQGDEETRAHRSSQGRFLEEGARKLPGCKSGFLSKASAGGESEYDGGHRGRRPNTRLRTGSPAPRALLGPETRAAAADSCAVGQAHACAPPDRARRPGGGWRAGRRGPSPPLTACRGWRGGPPGWTGAVRGGVGRRRLCAPRPGACRSGPSTGPAPAPAPGPRPGHRAHTWRGREGILRAEPRLGCAAAGAGEAENSFGKPLRRL